MSLNWSGFFSGLGGGLTDYAKYQSEEDETKKREARQAKLDQIAAEERTYQHEQDRLATIRLDREDLRKPAEHQADQYAKAGIMVGPDFQQNQMQAGLHSAGQNPGNAAGMAINALRAQGQQGNQYVASEGAAALKEALRTGSPSAPMAHGGFATIDPSVLASLKNAAAMRDETRAYREGTRAFEAARLHDSEEKTREAQAADEAEGLAFLGSDARGQEPLRKAFGGAFQSARIGSPTMSPGRLAKQTMEGLRSARPDLIPKAPSAGGESLYEQRRAEREAARKGGNTVATPGKTPPPPPPPLPTEAMAQRWDELTAGGLDEAAATQQVLHEFHRQ